MILVVHRYMRWLRLSLFFQHDEIFCCAVSFIRGACKICKKFGQLVDCFPQFLATRIKALWPGTSLFRGNLGKNATCWVCVPRESDDKPVLFEPMMKSVFTRACSYLSTFQTFLHPNILLRMLIIWDILRRGDSGEWSQASSLREALRLPKYHFLALIYWNMQGSCFKGTPQSVPKRLASQT